MRKLALVLTSGAIFAAGLVAAPAALASNPTDPVIEEVRARVCMEEYGYGVVYCYETIDPVLLPALRLVDGAYRLVGNRVDDAVADATQLIQDAPGTVDQQVHYVYCWVTDPTNPYC